MLSLQLFKFPGRQFDPFDVIKNFTTTVKIKVFSKEDDLFNDIFQQKSTLKDIFHMAQIQFPPAEFKEFKLYRERRLENIPLDKLHLEPIREPTPCISISGSSGTNKSKSKYGKESPEQSKQSESDHNKSEGSVRDTAQSKENSEQQVLLPIQVKVRAPLIQPTKLVRTELEKDWETFNELINIEEQNMETPENTAKTMTEMVIETVVNAPETEHIPIAPSSEIMLNIEEILVRSGKKTEKELKI